MVDSFSPLISARAELERYIDDDATMKCWLTKREAAILLRYLDEASRVAGDNLRGAVGRARLVTTVDEVRMWRADWDVIVEAAIDQRRALDPRGVRGELTDAPEVAERAGLREGPRVKGEAAL